MGLAKEKLTEDQRESIARSLFKVTDQDRNKGELHGLCPIHQEKNPSFSYNYKKDQFNCLACSESGDLVGLFSKVKGYAPKGGFKEFCRQYGLETVGRSFPRTPSPPSTDDPDTDPDTQGLDAIFNKFPELPAAWIQRLETVRGWSPETLKRYDIRLQTYYQKKDTGALVKIKTPERVAIPIRDRSGKIQNIRLYKPGATQMKIISWGKGFGKCRLFPAMLQGGTVLLCEGEQDTICALSNGFNGITQTVKRKTWPRSHKNTFKDRDVVIAYDADRAGEQYASHAAAALADVAKSIRILTWPDYMGRQPGGDWPKDHGEDLTDFFVKHKKTVADLQSLVDQAVPYETQSFDSGASEFFEISASGRLSFKPRLLAEKILSDVDLMTDSKSNQLYRWNGKFWEKYSDIYIEKICLKHLGKEAQKSRVKDAAYQVMTLSALPHGRELNDQFDWICLRNCMLNLKSLEEKQHAKDFYCTVALDIDFDPDSKTRCDRWVKFLDETVQTPEAIAQVQEFVGYCLTRDTRYAKCLLLVGPGSDGKSVFLKTVRKLVGLDNCSAISFKDLEDQFMRSSLYGKLLNFSTEVGSRALESPYFKAIVTGDPISGAYKHQDVFSFTPYCKLAFAANKFPRVLDNSDGFFRRVLPVSFKKQFIENDPDTDPDLERKLEVELPGIFLWSLVGLHRLRDQKTFTDCQETRDQIILYRRLNNPVIGFTEDVCLLGDDYKTSKDDLYENYKRYCRTGGFTPLNYDNFFRELYSAITNLKQYRPQVGGKRDRYVKGIAVEIYLNDE